MKIELSKQELLNLLNCAIDCKFEYSDFDNICLEQFQTGIAPATEVTFLKDDRKILSKNITDYDNW